jgi:hypothetical protein
MEVEMVKAKTKIFDPFVSLKFKFGDDGMFQSCFVPKNVETCVCCDRALTIDCTGWDSEEGNEFWWPSEIDLDCIRGMKCYEEYENSEYWRMTYVYWLPVEQHCKRWLNRMLRIYYKLDPIPQKWLERNGQLTLFKKPWP